MSTPATLAQRIDAEFAAGEQKIKQLQERKIEEFQRRQQRQEKLEKTLAELSDTWRPRLETLAKRFADRVKVTPTRIGSSCRRTSRSGNTGTTTCRRTKK